VLTQGKPLPCPLSATASKQIEAYAVDKVDSARQPLKVSKLQAQISGD